MLKGILRLSPAVWQDTLMKTLLSLIVLGALGPVKVVSEDIVPITFQTFAVILPAVLFGWRIGTLAVVLYLIAGSAGAPVFANYASGAEHLFGITGGFLFGFVFAALIVGYLSEIPAARKPLPCFGIWVLGHLIILLLGTIWYMRFNPEWVEMVKTVLPGAAIKSAFGLLITQLTLRIVLKRDGYYQLRS
jgi:biotin transport system substrate-specific component